MKRNRILISVMACFLLAASFFVMEKKEVHAAGDYTLQVNKGTNVVTVFRSDGTPERAFVCSVGSATPIGTFYTPNKYRWHELDGPSYGQYCTRITAGYLFHSVWYYRNGDYASQSYVQYNKLGTTASHGCVRLTVADAKWIYDNCPLGTKVVVLYGSAANDPLGKPVAIKVPNVKEGWDPTDPNPANPYSAAMPSIDVGGANTTVSYGSNFNPLAGIVARDSLGNDITSSLAYAGSVNTKKLGNYKITYRVTDALGRTAYADVVYNVKDTAQASITGVKKSLKKEYNSTLNLKKNVKAKTVTGKSLTKNIKVKIIYPGGKKEKAYNKSTLKLTKLGTYKVNYYVTNPANGLESKAVCSVKVQDTKKPKLSGIKSKKSYEYNSVVNLKSGVKAKLVSGKNMTSKIVIKAKAPGQKSYKKLSSSQYKSYKLSKVGTYQIQYSVTNPTKNPTTKKKAVAQKVMTIAVSDTKAPVITGTPEMSVTFGMKLNLRSGVAAKLQSGTDVTSSLKLKVTTPQNVSNEFTGTEYTFDQAGTYVVAYTAVNPNNARAAATVSRKITVSQDTRVPIISIAANKPKTVQEGTPYDVYNGVTAVLGPTNALGQSSVTGITAKITDKDGKEIAISANGTVTFGTAGEYTITYTVKNPNNPDKVGTATHKVTAEAKEPDVTPDAPGQPEPQYMDPLAEEVEQAMDEAVSQAEAENQDEGENQDESENQDEGENQDEAVSQDETESQDEVKQPEFKDMEEPEAPEDGSVPEVEPEPEEV